METIEQADILLVDDNPIDADLEIRALKREALVERVTWVKNGEQALDYVFRRGEYAGRSDSGPRLILLDLKMPRMDGKEVLQMLKADASTRRIPVVVMTSSLDDSDLATSYDLGANSYLLKPLDYEALSEVARQAGRYWLAINRVAPREGAADG